MGECISEPVPPAALQMLAAIFGALIGSRACGCNLPERGCLSKGSLASKDLSDEKGAEMTLINVFGDLFCNNGLVAF